MNLNDQVNLITLLSVVWAITTIKPLRKGWKSLSSNDKWIVFAKISLAVALVTTSILFLVIG